MTETFRAIHTWSCSRCNEKLSKYEVGLCVDCIADEIAERTMADRLVNNSLTPPWFDDDGPGGPQGRR